MNYNCIYNNYNAVLDCNTDLQFLSIVLHVTILNADTCYILKLISILSNCENINN